MNLRVACARGKTPGEDVANVFERSMLKLAAFYSAPVELHASSRIYHSDLSLLKEYNDPEDLERIILQDAQHYENFLKEQAAQGTRVIFHISINAQSMQLVGQHLQAVSIEHYDQVSHSILLIRDHSQGSSTSERKKSLPTKDLTKSVAKRRRLK